jgi:hypothetical protein
MPNYNQGKVYMLSSAQTTDVYIGSTCKTLKQRLDSHKHDFKRWLNGTNHYVSSYELVKYDDCVIELLDDEYICDTKSELLMLEQAYIDEYPNCVNRQNAVRDPEHVKKYKEQNYQRDKERREQYRQQNKERIQQQYIYRNRTNRKYVGYARKYGENHKKKRAEKFNCPCGGKYTYNGKSYHEKTQIHMRYIAKQQEQQT